MKKQTGMDENRGKERDRPVAMTGEGRGGLLHVVMESGAVWRGTPITYRDGTPGIRWSEQMPLPRTERGDRRGLFRVRLPQDEEAGDE